MMPPDLPPAPAASTASAQDSSSDKPAPAYISNRGFAPGIILGMLLGLGCTWLLGPIRESNTEPYQLRAEDRYHYMAAIALEYMQRGDLGRAVSKLAELRSPLDPIQAMAAAACELGGGGYLESRGGAAALGAMAVFYQLQGRRGCADRLLPALEIADTKVIQATVPANVDMLAPPPSKTPPLHIGLAAPTVGIVPTRPARRSFAGRLVSAFCDPALPGIIEVSVVDFGGEGIPGERIRVSWGDEESIFVSGLKVERGDAYADFQMETGVGYRIEMPGASDLLDASLDAEPCLASGGYESLQSYRVVFRQTG